MPDIAPDPLQELLARLREARAAAAQDPFGDPVLLIALAISRRMDDGQLDLGGLADMVQRLSDAAAADRAKRLAAYVGLDGGTPSLAALAERLVRPDPEDSPIPFARFRALVETPRFAAVFTAHPTFSLPYETGVALAEAASGADFPTGLPHRPSAPTLAEEF
ncbi:MAG: phosphoenolpyruvate carboxylase, partial [Paracraurococcus sp.]